jgi:hypothetical protein
MQRENVQVARNTMIEHDGNLPECDSFYSKLCRGSGQLLSCISMNFFVGLSDSSSLFYCASSRDTGVQVSSALEFARRGYLPGTGGV